MAVLREAMVRCPSLQFLDIFRRGYPYPPFYPVPAVDVTLGSRLEQLRAFRGCALAPSSMLRYLASLPSLEAFEAPVSVDLSLAGLPCVFPAVRELRFLSAPVQHLSALVAAVQSAYVHTLELSANDDPGPRAVNELLEIVAAHPSAGTLRQFRFAPDGLPDYVAGAPGRLAVSDVRPLLRLRSLRDVILNANVVDPAEDAIAQMLDAWPALETFELGALSALGIFGLEFGSQLTLAQLVTVARTHSELRELACTVFVRAGAPLPDARGLVHTGLRRLRLAFHGEDTPADRAAVAHLLATVFPGMSDFTGVDSTLKGLMEAGRQARLAGTSWTLGDYTAHAESAPSQEYNFFPTPFQHRDTYYRWGYLATGFRS
jgi:hypothetical protein